MNVAAAIFDVIERDSLLLHAQQLGNHARHTLGEALPQCRIRGEGLFLGIEFPEEPQDIAGRALEQGVVLNVTQKTVVRLAPPLIITADEWNQGLDTLISLVRG